MTTDRTIQILQRYASHGIRELTKQDALLAPIDELVQQTIADSNNTSAPIDDKEAKKLIKWLPEDNIGKPFDDRTVQNYLEIGKKVLEVATNPRSNNATLLKAAAYLHPLFSQDKRTVGMGFDLEEYMDWYFKDTTQEAREKYAQQLMEDWHLR